MIMIIGARTLAASTSAVNVFVNPGPRVTVATPNRPVRCANPHAAITTPASWTAA